MLSKPLKAKKIVLSRPAALNVASLNVTTWGLPNPDPLHSSCGDAVRKIDAFFSERLVDIVCLQEPSGLRGPPYVLDTENYCFEGPPDKPDGYKGPAPVMFGVHKTLYDRIGGKPELSFPTPRIGVLHWSRLGITIINVYAPVRKSDESEVEKLARKRFWEILHSEVKKALAQAGRTMVVGDFNAAVEVDVMNDSQDVNTTHMRSIMNSFDFAALNDARAHAPYAMTYAGNEAFPDSRIDYMLYPTNLLHEANNFRVKSPQGWPKTTKHSLLIAGIQISTAPRSQPARQEASFSKSEHNVLLNAKYQGWVEEAIKLQVPIIPMKLPKIDNMYKSPQTEVAELVYKDCRETGSFVHEAMMALEACRQADKSAARLKFVREIVNLLDKGETAVAYKAIRWKPQRVTARRFLRAKVGAALKGELLAHYIDLLAAEEKLEDLDYDTMLMPKAAIPRKDPIGIAKHLWTDGSCSEGIGIAGWSVVDPTTGVHVCGNISVDATKPKELNSGLAEVVAVLEGLRFHDDDFIIFHVSRVENRLITQFFYYYHFLNI